MRIVGVLALMACGDKPGVVIEGDIASHIPSTLEISLGPNPATTTDDLQVSIFRESIDSDGDEVEYTYVWTKNSVLFENETATVSSDETSKGDEWGVMVYASDGEEQSDSVLPQEIINL